MMVHLGNTMPLTSEDIQMITARLSIGVAEKDTTVSVDETEKLARSNPQSELYVLPGSLSPIRKNTHCTLGFDNYRLYRTMILSPEQYGMYMNEL
jgi:hypothetical protein